VSAARAVPDRLIHSEPRQRRSKDLLERLVASARALIDERDFETISIADIADRAEVSVGVLYTRFPTKEHLLVHLASLLAATSAEQLLLALADDRVAECSLYEIAEIYFMQVAKVFAKNRRLLRAVSLLVRTSEHDELRSIVIGFNAAVHQRLTECVLRHRRSIRHEVPERAIGFALLAASATLRELILYEEPVSKLARGHTRAGLEAARLFTAYLTCAP